MFGQEREINEIAYGREILGDPKLIAKCATKLPKKEINFESSEAYELSIWASENRYKIRQRVEVASAEQLKKIAEIIYFKS